MADRVLAHLAAHTGVDIPTLTTTSFPAMQTPPAVIQACLLAAALLNRTWPTSCNASGEAVNRNGVKIAEEQRAYQAACQRQPRLADELDRLQHAIDSSPTPIAPTTPHGQRMRCVAEQIRTRATALLTNSHGEHIASQTSIAACRQHTDLTCPTIAAIHDTADAQPAFSGATVARYRREDPASTADTGNSSTTQTKPGAPQALRQRAPHTCPDQQPDHGHWKLDLKLETGLSGNNPPSPRRSCRRSAKSCM